MRREPTCWQLRLSELTAPHPPHVQSETGFPDAVQDAVRDHDCRALAGAWHRREHRDLLDVRPAAASSAAGVSAGGVGEPGRTAAEGWRYVVQPEWRLRRGIQLPDVPGPR